jgi:polysaccharide export outer membrane protein
MGGVIEVFFQFASAGNLGGQRGSHSDGVHRDISKVAIKSMAKTLGWLPALTAALALSACTSSRGGSIPYDVADFGVPDPISNTTLDENYQIAPLDTLKINVFQVPDLSGEYSVDLTGHIAMPLVGNVRAVDMTTMQLQQALKTKLEVAYLKNPDVTVGITKSNGSNITVDGSVRSPGVFPVSGRITLIQAVAMAKGMDQAANERRVAIFRQIGGQRMAAAFDLKSIREGESEDPVVYRGDIIIVDGSATKQAFREVLQALPIVGVFNPVL